MWYAVLGCTAITVTYVGLLYMWKGQLPRDHPLTVQRRFVSVGMALMLSWLPMYGFVMKEGLSCTVATLLGFRLEGLLHAACVAVFLTCLAFLAQLIWMGLMAASGIPTALGVRELVFWRNVVVAPIAEEFVFRACMSPLFLLQGMSPVSTVFLTPVFFGAAHLHHVYEKVVVEREELLVAVLQVMVQFTYTTLFGWYANFLFIRTRHIIAPVLAHAICNYCGVPNFPEIIGGRYKIVLLPCLLIGVLAFALLMGPATSPSIFGDFTLDACFATGH